MSKYITPTIDFSTINYETLIQQGKFLMGFSHIDGKFCKMDHTGAITVIEGGTNSGNDRGDLNITYLDLLYKVNNSELQTGLSYLISDFQTIYDQPDFDSSGNAKLSVETKTSIVEPLLCLATSNNTLASEVYSPLFPKDKIHYDISWGATEVMGVAAKGRITERIDDRNNRTDYDHRHIYFKRYALSIPEFGQTIYDRFKDTSNAFSEFLTFGADCFDNYIGNYASFYDTWGEPFLLANNVFEDNCALNKTKEYFINNHFGTDSCENTFDFYSTNNRAVSYFSRNICMHRFQGNIIGTQTSFNVFGRIFRYNNLGDNTAYNDFASTISDTQFGSGIQSNIFPIGVDISGSDYTLATHLRGAYTCNILSREDGTKKLTYYNNSDTLIIALLED